MRLDVRFLAGAVARYALEQANAARQRLAAISAMCSLGLFTRLKVEQTLEGGVNVEGRGELARIAPQLAHVLGMSALKVVGHADAEEGHALLELALIVASHVAEPRAVIAHEHDQRVAQGAALAQVHEKGEQVGVEHAQRVVHVVAGLRVEYEAELGLVVAIGGEHVARPVHHVRVTRYGAETEATEARIVALRLQVEHAHVVVGRLMLEAEHAQLKGAYRLHVLGPLGHVAGLLEVGPDPGKLVDKGGVVEAAARLGQLRLRVAGEHGQQSLGRAVADDVVALEDDEAELLDHVGVGARQEAQPAHARDRVEAEHEHVVAESVARQRLPRVTHVQAGLVGDARVDVAVDGAVLGAAVDLEEVRDERHVVDYLREKKINFLNVKKVDQKSVFECYIPGKMRAPS